MKPRTLAPYEGEAVRWVSPDEIADGSSALAFLQAEVRRAERADQRVRIIRDPLGRIGLERIEHCPIKGERA